jgi:hypothetical protein
VREHLKEGGIMVVNMNMRGDRQGNINQYLSDTISSVFPEVYTVDVAGATNRELFASESANLLETFRTNQAKIQDADLKALMEQVDSNLTAYVPGNYKMTDDNAPVELLGIQVIDELIQDEVRYYKEIYHDQGIQGVMDALGQ